MQSVITEKQARQITGGRKPHVPVEYEEACKQLSACLTLDEAKYWDNKADALAAWAKIYHDGKVLRDARALKLLAHRRLYEIARELRPKRIIKRGKSGELIGNKPGAPSLLREQGLSVAAVNAARELGNMSEEKFQTLVDSPRPPSPGSARVIARRLDTPNTWGVTELASIFSNLVKQLRSHKPSEMADLVKGGDFAAQLVEKVRFTIEWLDEFEQRLPK